ncbi:MAG: hypothetical protein V4604_02195 [Bacteroidota bacterium]
MKLKRFLIYGCFLTVLCSCDVSTHEYISFETDDSDSLPTYIGWIGDTSTISFFVSGDNTFTYDRVLLLFFKDKSILEAFKSPGYEYLGDVDEDGDEDSVKTTFYHFAIPQTDSRVKENDSVLVTFLKGKKTKRLKVLYKKVSESSFLDRIPLPRLH